MKARSRRLWTLTLVAVLVCVSIPIGSWIVRRASEIHSVGWSPLYSSRVERALLPQPATEAVAAGLQSAVAPTCGTCQGPTCVNTCPETCANTCQGTCYNTCQETCSTCVNTCQRTCSETCQRTCVGCVATLAETCFRTCDCQTSPTTVGANCGSPTARPGCYTGAFDFGDASPGYLVLLKEDGARHKIDGKLYLGANEDAEKDGLPSPDALGDDLSGKPDDEDGVWVAASFVPGSIATLIVASSLPGYLDAWIDFGRDGHWGEEDQVFASQKLDAGLNVLSVRVPAAAAEGLTFARFRLSAQGGLKPVGEAPEGEVEDYSMALCARLVASIQTDRLAYPVGAKQTISFFLSEESDVVLTAFAPDGTVTPLAEGIVPAGAHRFPGPQLQATVLPPAGVQWLRLEATSRVSGCRAVVETPFRVVQ